MFFYFKCFFIFFKTKNTTSVPDPPDNPTWAGGSCWWLLGLSSSYLTSITQRNEVFFFLIIIKNSVQAPIPNRRRIYWKVNRRSPHDDLRRGRRDFGQVPGIGGPLWSLRSRSGILSLFNFDILDCFKSLIINFQEEEKTEEAKKEEGEPEGKRVRFQETQEEEKEQNQKKKANNNNNNKGEQRRIKSGVLSKIPPELFPHILKFLSSEVTLVLIFIYLSTYLLLMIQNIYLFLAGSHSLLSSL